MPRFLFLFSDTGGGHRAAAQAVAEQMAQLYGAAAQVALLDILKAVGRWPFDRMPGWYPAMVRLRGIPWAVGYRLTDRKRAIHTMTRLTWPYTRHPLQRILSAARPDVIVSFHGIANYALRLATRQLTPAPPLATVILDMVTVHAAWFAPGHDLYIVPTDEARARAIHFGIEPARLRVIGMPTRPQFADAMDLSQSAARRSLGLPDNGPMVLLVGGGEGMGPLIPVVEAVAAGRPMAQLVVIAGRNQTLKQALTELRLPTPVQVEGFVSNMALWMRAADILVTKAGPNTLSEAFIAGLPVVIYNAIPGQETGNVQYVMEHGAGYWAPQPAQVAENVLALLANPAKRQAMAARARMLARPTAAADIARALWRLGAVTL